MNQNQNRVPLFQVSVPYISLPRGTVAHVFQKQVLAWNLLHSRHSNHKELRQTKNNSLWLQIPSREDGDCLTAVHFMLLSIFVGFGYAYLRIRAKESQRNLHNRRWGIWSSQRSSGLRVRREVGGGRQKAARMAWQCEGRDSVRWKYLWENSRCRWLVHSFRKGVANVEFEIVGTFKMQIPPPYLYDSQILNKVYYISQGLWHVWWKPREELCFTFELIL